MNDEELKTLLAKLAKRPKESQTVFLTQTALENLKHCGVILEFVTNGNQMDCKKVEFQAPFAELEVWCDSNYVLPPLKIQIPHQYICLVLTGNFEKQMGFGLGMPFQNPSHSP